MLYKQDARDHNNWREPPCSALAHRCYTNDRLCGYTMCAYQRISLRTGISSRDSPCSASMFVACSNTGQAQGYFVIRPWPLSSAIAIAKETRQNSKENAAAAAGLPWPTSRRSQSAARARPTPPAASPTPARTLLPSRCTPHWQTVPPRPTRPRCAASAAGLRKGVPTRGSTARTRLQVHAQREVSQTHNRVLSRQQNTRGQGHIRASTPPRNRRRGESGGGRGVHGPL